MIASAGKRRELYKIKKNGGWINTEFGYYSLDAWKKQGHITGDHDPWVYDDYMKKTFSLEDDGQYYLNGMNWEGAEFYPYFEEKVLEDRGDKYIGQDKYGRSVLYFKKSKDGYMPEYIDHPVRDMKSWKELCEWRMSPETEERYKDLERKIPEAAKAEREGKMIVQRYVGGYMYLRSLMGPEELLYLFYDDPELIHCCMRAWLALADAVTAFHQKFVTLDELYFGEDITYNAGPLISPAMMEEFLFPYYRELIERTRKRQIDQNRILYLHLDTDGKIQSVIPHYQKLGFQVFSPCEAASGSDVVQIGKDFPDVVLMGGIDKRKFAASREELKQYLDHVLPEMKKRGGYIPTCDHGVPEEADFSNYLYYRKRCIELSGEIFHT